MKNISNTYKLLLLLFAGAFTQLSTKEESVEKVDIFQSNESINEKHASFHVESIIINEPSPYNQNDEKHASSHVEEIIINDDKYNSTNDDDFLDAIANDIRIEAPHEPRNNSSTLTQIAIAAKIAHNVSINFYKETIKPTIVDLWNNVISFF